jgi:hypothetical protein
MSGGADRKELGQAFHDTKENGLQIRIQAGLRSLIAG